MLLALDQNNRGLISILLPAVPSASESAYSALDGRMLNFNHKLSGTIPTEVGLLSKLTGMFGFPGNRLSGTLPTQCES